MARWWNIMVLALAGLAGCGPPQSPPSRIKRLPPDAFSPTTEVRKVVVENIAVAAEDSDGDGIPDQVRVRCYLFPPATIVPYHSVVGKGSFRFEMYDSREPASIRRPLVQINYNDPQARQHLTRIWGNPVYLFALRLPPLPSHIQTVHIIGRFFPEGGDPDSEPEPGSVSATVTSTVMPRTTLERHSPPATGPDVRVIRIGPRPPVATQPE